ncbi:MAG: hypothetical protein COU81_02360 [Candidatus Portnoybacteria bacterium CG10_big_fil_rev_8_21_14_0_10_36_7]|uniref:YbhB/YbcL family Raf kinase inhibitor-like protein n=1 Tax=Candidatus Portnoybacteria bacterium CG10_big_fil_rev_8_21_14_0_10_36_7 TaxID=1974812 RepID=A0A2M8KDW8_9BACT|nr:MAG: hypothetical protein COU81_02360 [Candidatus Portnoybacteria bacterium CG10_big_fil_rev_8_21_14_0_10_36_7]
MLVKIKAFRDGDSMPVRYTCDDENINPKIEFLYALKEAKSLVLIFDDRDSPSGIWDYWVLWNILPRAKEIDEGSCPDGAICGINSFGQANYGGLCPAS